MADPPPGRPASTSGRPASTSGPPDTPSRPPDVASGSWLARRAYGPTLVVGLVSAAAATVGASRPWVSATATVRGLPPIAAQVDGAEVAPLAGALGFVLLAAFGAVIATRGRARRGLGFLVVVAALAVAVSVLHPGDTRAVVEQGLSAKGWSGGSYDTRTSLWRWVAGIGAVGCGLSGLAVAVFGGSWATMSTRYDAPATAADSMEGDGRGDRSGDRRDVATEADLWRAIDSGRDPTQSP